MDTRLKKSKMAFGTVSWFCGIIILAVNILGLLLEMSLYSNFPEQVRGVLSGDYQDTAKFRDHVLSNMSDFLSMSIAENPRSDHGASYRDISHDISRDISHDMEGWETEADAAYGMENDAVRQALEDAMEAEKETREAWEESVAHGVEDDGIRQAWEDAAEVKEEVLQAWEEAIEADEITPGAEYSADGFSYRSTGRVYQYYDYFSDRYGEQYDVIYRDYGMNKEAADAAHNRLRYNTNILYRIENGGEVLYTNYENLGAGSEGESCYSADIDSGTDGEAFCFVMPEGYNYLLYYDGTGLRVWKNGTEIKLGWTGFRMENDWYIPGYADIPVDDIYKDSRVYMAVAHTPGIIVKRNFDGNGNTYYSNQLYSIRMRAMDKKASYRNWLLGSVFALALTAVGLRLRAYRKEVYRAVAGVTGRIWYELKLLPVLAVLLLGLRGMIACLQSAAWQGIEYFREIYYGVLNMYYDGSIKLAVLAALFGIGGSILWLFFNDMRYNEKVWKRSLARKMACLFGTSMLKLPFSKRMVWYSLGGFLPCLICVCVPAAVFITKRYGGIAELLPFLILLAGVLFLQLLYIRAMRRMAVGMDSLVGQIETVHSGDLQESMEVPEGSGLSGAMEKLKEIRDGMDRAVREQVKSERMKVELIANVSHDIKTPLTSIISYVELLKQEDGLPEHLKEYVSILESKSQRLKAMVQDVFEVSKAASGELPVHMEILDFGKLIRQTVADMQEEIAESEMGIRCEMPDGAVMIYADGDRLYRVFQNLIQNALKYSLEGSRIYINLRAKEGKAIADVKNTSKEELPSDVDFTERFIRGDKSRTDGGSGLGLSIAQSFTEACGGTFRVETIADLFVVTIAFEEAG